MRFLPISIVCLALVLAPSLACSVEPGSSRNGSATASGDAHEGWFDGGFDDALQQARASSKLVFIDFFTTWCPPCKKLNRETFPDPAVKAELAKMVALKIDAESPVGQPLAQRYKVTGYPTLLVLDPQGREVGRIVGFKEPAVLVGLIQDIRDRTNL